MHSVLIVDDQKEFRSLVRLLIGEAYWVLGEAENGAVALQLCKTLRPDVVLLDVSMPVMDGFKAAQQILADRPNTQIIFCSQNDQSEYQQRGMSLGAVGYIVKSDLFRELTPLLEKAVAALDGR